MLALGIDPGTAICGYGRFAMTAQIEQILCMSVFYPNFRDLTM